MVEIPDGLYGAVDGVVRRLVGRSVPDLLRLRESLRELQATADEGADLTDALEDVREPVVADALRRFSPELRVAIIAVLLQAIQVLLSMRGLPATEPGPVVQFEDLDVVDVEQLVVQIVEESGEGTVTVKVGRNDPCPCASGVKLKRCHGR